MAQKSSVFEQTLMHKGYFNFSDLYNFCFQWLQDEGYTNLAEESYQEKLSDIGKEIKIKWIAKKKVTDYFRNIIELKWQIIGLVDAEIERGNKKEKTNKGDLRMDFSADLEKDYENRWADKPIWKFFRGVYDKYIIRTTIDEYEDRLTAKAVSFVSDIKAFLQLEGK